ncbi:hypothetical protein D3C71_2193910 [compost metagenome]
MDSIDALEAPSRCKPAKKVRMASTVETSAMAIKASQPHASPGNCGGTPAPVRRMPTVT